MKQAITTTQTVTRGRECSASTPHTTSEHSSSLCSSTRRELNTPMTTISLLDGLLIATVIGFATSLFTYLVYSGSLNFVSYGFSTFGSIFNKNVNKKYKDLKEYNEIKKIERAGKTYYFLSYILVSSLYLIALIVVFILFKTEVIL